MRNKIREILMETVYEAGKSRAYSLENSTDKIMALFPTEERLIEIMTNEEVRVYKTGEGRDVTRAELAKAIVEEWR